MIGLWGHGEGRQSLGLLREEEEESREGLREEEEETRGSEPGIAVGMKG